MTRAHWIGLLGIIVAVALLASRLQRGQDAMTALAERYVKLVLEVGQHDAQYVDAYYGPAAWQQQAAAAARRPLDEIDADAHVLRDALRSRPVPAGADDLIRLRRTYLLRQVEALGARVSMLLGTRLDFDEESKALYDAVAPRHTESEFQRIVTEIGDRLPPGPGSIAERYAAFRGGFAIPADRLDAVFRAAIDACRARTRRYITLPPEERFTVEYVTGKSWSGYNWYQGNYRSLIQVNTDLPVFIDRALDLACHEGYPGHHVYNVLLEQRLVRERGWPEYSVYALFSPQSLIAEGTANYGIEMAFPKAERLGFERRVLFPAAGLDPARADEYYAIQALVEGLSYARNEAARRYVDGEFDATAAADWLQHYALDTRARADQYVRFIDQYRSYVINYNLGKDLVARHIELESAGASDPSARWEAFARLLASPRVPSELRQ